MTNVKFTKEEVMKFLQLAIGRTEPSGDHSRDVDEIVPNIELMGGIAVELISTLARIAYQFEGRNESSIKQCVDKSTYWLDFIESEIMEDYRELHKTSED